MMKVLDVLKFESPISENESVIITFRLMEAPEFRARFYECLNCRGFGGSTFHDNDDIVPDEVGEEMYIHSRLCESLRRGVA